MANHTTPTTAAIDARVAELRTLAERAPDIAQDAVWAWLVRLGKQLPDRSAEAELAELFRHGVPGDAVDGQTEGAVLGFPTPAPGMDVAGRLGQLFAGTFVKVANPWLGKRFVRAEKRGTNSVNAAVFVIKLLAPQYRLRKAGDHYEGFDMRTWVAPSSLDPATQVLVIDYQENNPIVMNRIVDELVEVVPHTYLGKMTWTQDGGSKLWAYFALKSPIEA